MSKTLTHDASKSMLEEQLFTVLKGEHDGIDEIIRLHQAGVDVNAVDDKGFTPLMYATANGHVMAVCALREVGADFGRLSPMGYTALMMVVSQKDPLFSPKNHEDMVNALVDGGLHPNASDILFVAAQNANAATMNILLNRGIDPDLIDSKGNSAIFYAITTDNRDSLAVLLQRGHHQYRANHDRVTPLQFAITNNAGQCLQTYVCHENEGLDFGSQERNDRDYGLLCHALKSDFVHLAQYISKAGVSFFATDALDKPFIVKIIDKANLSNEEHVNIVNKALQQSLLEIQDRPRDRAVTKWRQLRDFFKDETIQDIVDYDVITSLEKSLIERDVLQHIVDKYEARNNSGTEINDSSQELSIDDNSDTTASLKRSPESPSATLLKRTKTLVPSFN